AWSELWQSNNRRALAIIVISLAGALLLMSNSKTALGLAIGVPVAAWIILRVRKWMGASPATLISILVLSYMVFCAVSGFSSYRLSYMLYGNGTFTGRSIIWWFASVEIAQKPLLG